MESAPYHPLFRLLFLAFIVANFGAVPCVVAEVIPIPASPRAIASETYEVTADGLPVFTGSFRNVHCAWFDFDGAAEVVIRTAAPIRDFTISPRSRGIAAKTVGSALKFRLDRPSQLVVTINGGEKLILFADAIDRNAPRLGQPGVTSIRDFGVDATGGRVETERIQAAIDRVAAQRGVLYFPRGVYVSGTLRLKSDLNLHLAGGAVLLASTYQDDFPADFPDASFEDKPVTQMTESGIEVAYLAAIANRRFILVDDASNVRVTGRGAIDGQGKLIRTEMFRPQLVHIRNSSNVEFNGVALVDAGLYNCHILMSDHVTVRGVKILSDQTVHNTDGIDPDSSQDVLVDGCFFHCTDDPIAIKSSGYGGLLQNVERITVRNCVMITTTTAMKLGSESFADHHRDILFENNDVLEADRAINLSSMDGSRYENVRYINNRVEKIIFKTQQRNFVLHVRNRVAGRRVGSIGNVLIRDLTIAEECPNPSRLAGFSDSSDVRGIRFENLSIAGRARMSAVDAGIELNEFAREVSFSSTSGPTTPPPAPRAQ